MGHGTRVRKRVCNMLQCTFLPSGLRLSGAVGGKSSPFSLSTLEGLDNAPALQCAGSEGKGASVEANTESPSCRDCGSLTSAQTELKGNNRYAGKTRNYLLIDAHRKDQRPQVTEAPEFLEGSHILCFL